MLTIVATKLFSPMLADNLGCDWGQDLRTDSLPASTRSALHITVAKDFPQWSLPLNAIRPHPPVSLFFAHYQSHKAYQEYLIRERDTSPKLREAYDQQFGLVPFKNLFKIC